MSHIILQSGGETSRAESTIKAVAASTGMSAHSFATPTGVVITVSDNSGAKSTEVVRLDHRSVDFSKLDAANTISRKLFEKVITLDEAVEKAQKLMEPGKKRYALPGIAAGVSSGFFSLMFGGMWIDFFTAFIAGVIVRLFAMSFKRESMFQFVVSLVGSFIIALVADFSSLMFGSGNTAAAITGAMMPLLPGLAMTNAISDTINGNLVSANARGSEAAIVAISCALGVCSVLSVFTPELNKTPFDTPLTYMYCFPAAAAFCILFRVPTRGIVICALIGVLGYAVCNAVTPFSMSFGYFLASTVIAVLSETFARFIKMPATIFLSSAVIPIVPGSGLFFTMLYIVQKDYSLALHTGMEAILNVVMISVGFSLVSFAFKNLSSAFVRS